ncbi:MAG TPA: zinc-binding dehydrogenase, partial [Dehalococcoidia bacterium]|nr:zinc-binding dehydrogenase [Dehalococcoidia bacterium]
MRAIQVVAPRRIELIDVPKPEMAPGMVLTRTALVSICGSDWPIAMHTRPEAEYPMDPGRPGHEVVSVVEESDVPELRPGDRVLDIAYDGAFREFQVRDPERLIPLPKDRPLEELLMSQPLGVVLHACHKWPSVLGWSVAVIGQGTIGLFFTMQLRMQGAGPIITLDLEDGRLALGKRLGATHTFNTVKEDPIAGVLDLTGGQGADMVVEAVGQELTYNLCAPLVRKGGYITLYGLAKKNPMLFDFLAVTRKEPTIITSIQGDKEKDFTLARDLIASGRVDVRPVITHHLTIEQVQHAFELAESRED